jgi:hypothetical protein
MARFRLTFPTIPTATLGPQRGHIGATNDQIAADNTGHQWSSILTAQQLTSAGIPGRRITPVLSRTEEVAWASIHAGSVPQQARAVIEVVDREVPGVRC